MRQPAKTFAADKEQKIKRNELERKELEEQKAKDKEKILSIELKHNTLAMKLRMVLTKNPNGKCDKTITNRFVLFC